MTKLSSFVRVQAGVLAGVVLIGLPIVGTGLFSSASSDKEHVENTQTLSVLVSVPNARFSSQSRGGGDIEVVGGSALLASSGPTGTLADIETPVSDRIGVYVVREGDTLSQIAGMFGVSTNTIVWANDNISHGDAISPGQTIVILPISGVRHPVESGDTLKSLAKKYDGNLEEILTYNNLTADSALSVGDVVIIPDGEIAAPVKTYSKTTPVSSSSETTYSGYYIRPVSGGSKSQGIHGYNGVDLATYYGAPVFASASGKVIISRCGWNGGYGCYVVIDHSNGTQTLYAHNSENIAYSGQSVVQGQVVGYVGNTGRATGSHLHFEVRGAYNPF